MKNAREHLELKSASHEERCPFHHAGRGDCKLSRVAVSERAARFCRSDDYDGCPTYLGYLLRRSSPLRTDNDWYDVKG